MPLPERLIRPVAVSRGTLQVAVPDELEGVTNGSLANVIRQLSSLSRHAEEMFGNLFSEAERLAHRSAGIQARIDRLAVQVTSLDSTVEEVSLQDIHLKKAFRSSKGFDQQVVSRETMPKAMLEMYLACDKPPPLDKLNPYREDGKDGLKFYTDPTYFFELWRQEMLKDTERMMHDRGKKYPYLSLASFASRDFFDPVPGKGQGGGINGQKERSKGKRNRQANDSRHPEDIDSPGGGGMQKRPSGIIGYDPALGPPPADLVNSRGGGQQQRPNSIELRRPSYPQQQQQQQQSQPMGYMPPPMAAAAPSAGYQYNANQEPIYTPRILRSEQPPSPQRQPQQMQQMPLINQQQHQPPQFQQYQPFSQPQHQMEYVQQVPTTVPVSMPMFNQQPAAAAATQQPDHPGSAAGTPTRRPNEPPPAPPSTEGTPTRQHPNHRDSLPPPPPPPPVSEMQAVSINNGPVSFNKPMQQQQQQALPPHSSPMHQQLLNQLNSRNQERQQQQQDQSDLPPPPPVPATTASATTLEARVPVGHMAPSPPPPPPIEATSAAEAAAANGIQEEQRNNSFSPPRTTVNGPTATTGGGAPPPPPPPPPTTAPPKLTNGGLSNGDSNADGSTFANGSPPKNILSPQGVKKQSVIHHKHSVQEGIRSDLLKAIRDGIALRKVEERKAEAEAKDKEEKSGSTSGQSDVASILARRVAVEMSDSEGDGQGGASDSEYDSDDWGDESQA